MRWLDETKQKRKKDELDDAVGLWAGLFVQEARGKNDSNKQTK